MGSREAISNSSAERSRAVKRRLRREELERRNRRRAERDAFLEAQLEPGELVVARIEDRPLVTERRILMAHQLMYPPRRGEWVCESIAFDQITRWALGRRHDHRPILRLEHTPHARIERVPRHHFLWFRWGNAEVLVTCTSTTLEFAKDTDPVQVAICERLERAGVQPGEPFLIRPAGTRAQRLRGSRSSFRRALPWRRARFRLQEVVGHLYRGRLSWRVRIPSWLLLAVPAWFIDPWLVVPAIVLVEAAWIVGLQWSWHQGRHRRGG